MSLCGKTDHLLCLHDNAIQHETIDCMSAQLALKREQEAMYDMDCQIESLSIADNTPIEELVLILFSSFHSSQSLFCSFSS